MNDQTHLVFDLEKILINEVKKCLSNTKHFKNVSNNIDSEDVKSYMKKLQSEKSAEIRERNIYETIIDSITVLLGSDKFKFAKTFKQHCQYCQNFNSSSLEKRYLKINLENYSGEEFNINEFFEPLQSEWRCKNCKKNIVSEFYFHSLPEILIIILGAKGEEKALDYKYKENFQFTNKNNRPEGINYALKALIGQISKYEFKSYIFRNERDFKNIFEGNKPIFSYPTILFYEGDKMISGNDEDSDYLDPNEMPERKQGARKIMIYFNFRLEKKQIYLEIENNEKFGNAIIALKEKYSWLKRMRNLRFLFGSKYLDENKTLQENGLEDNSEIDIIK